MFNKLKAVLKKKPQQLPQPSEENSQEALDKELLKLTYYIEDDRIPEIKVRIKALLAQGANINVSASTRMCGLPTGTILHNAVYQDKPELVEFFIRQGSEINVKNRYGQTPLYHVKSKAVTQQLLNAGAHIWTEDHEKCTPLEGSIRHQTAVFAAKKLLPNSIHGNPKIHHEANETLAKAYLKEKSDFERPNCPEEIISKSDWETWKEESLKEDGAFAMSLASLPSTSKTVSINDSVQSPLQQENSLQEAMDLLEKSQSLQFQQQVDKTKQGHLAPLFFAPRCQISKEKKSTESEKTPKLANG